MRTAIVIPCFNEAQRIHREDFTKFLATSPAASLLFVNDGSTDRTLEVLLDLQMAIGLQAEVLNLRINRGKAEAVRRGLMRAVDIPGIEIVGFWDADLSTPLLAVEDFTRILASRPDIQMVFGSRVRLLGRDIERRASRHYLGRMFATAASMVLALPIYDTQCGAKLFRVNKLLVEVLRTPFCSRWIFDVELIARFFEMYRHDDLRAKTAIYEFPLDKWTDVAGSKVSPRDFIAAALELVQIYRKHRKHKFGPSKRPETVQS